MVTDFRKRAGSSVGCTYNTEVESRFGYLYAITEESQIHYDRGVPMVLNIVWALIEDAQTGKIIRVDPESVTVNRDDEDKKTYI